MNLGKRERERKTNRKKREKKKRRKKESERKKNNERIKKTERNDNKIKIIYKKNIRTTVFSRYYVTLQPAMSIGWLVGWVVGWSVSWSHFTFFHDLISLTLLLLP